MGDIKFYGKGGIMFAKYFKRDEKTTKADLHDFCGKVQNMIRKQRGVALFEECDDMFLASCKPENVGDLWELSQKMHRDANRHQFDMKICLHFGPYKSGVSATALGIVSYFGRPMNEACRMFKGMVKSQTSVSAEFIRGPKTSACAGDKTVIPRARIVESSLVFEHSVTRGRLYPSEIIQGKGAYHKVNLQGKGTDGKFLADGDMCRVLIDYKSLRNPRTRPRRRRRRRRRRRIS